MEQIGLSTKWAHSAIYTDFLKIRVNLPNPLNQRSIQRMEKVETTM